MFIDKINNIREIYKKKNKKGILIKKQNNLAWILGGRFFINIASVDATVQLLITDCKAILLANNIEAVRIKDEELSNNSELEIYEYNWFEQNKKNEIINEYLGKEYITDEDIEDELFNIRTILKENDITMYEQLCKDTANAMKNTTFQIKKGMSEFQIAAMLSKNCIEMGIEPVVNLVAADDRIKSYRHPLPTNKILNDYVMIAVCGRRNGLISCLTRFVGFQKISKELNNKKNTTLLIDTMMIKNTIPGQRLNNIFNKVVKMYEENGYKDEWKKHHQGGLTGYNSRELKADFNTDFKVKENQVYAWNPSITGYKSEDTILVGSKENKILTIIDEFPKIEINYNGNKVLRNDILIREVNL